MHRVTPKQNAPYKRKEVIGDCTLYLGDCMDVIPALGKVDAVVTDPPYGINADSNMAKQSGQQYGKAAAKKTHYRQTNWDNKPIDIEPILRINLPSIIWGGNYFNVPPASCWLIWDKENGSNNFADCEMAWTNLPKAVRLKRHMWNGMLRKGLEERYGHPTQKPVALMRWCLSFLPDAKTILDPFMGSGTTGVACVKEGRSFIGVELDEDYFNLSVKRIAEAYQQGDLFINAPTHILKTEAPLLPGM